MRCPKCGYISFDYNQVCPKCSKDISSEQEKLHIPAFRPDPPSLLGALIGEANESHIGIRMPEASESGYAKEPEIEFGDSSSFESGEVSFDSQELVRSMESQEQAIEGESGDLESQRAEDTSDFEFESPVAEQTPPGATEMEPSTAADEPQEFSAEEVVSPIDSSELNLDEISLDDSGTTPQTTGEDLGQETGFDFEGPDSGVEKAEQEQEKDEVELNLDDLKVNNDTGELEVNIQGHPFEETENPLQMDEINLEEAPVQTEKKNEEEESAKADSATEDEELSIDLEDLDLDLDLDADKPH